MVIIIKQPRKDGKTPVVFNAGYIGSKSRPIRALIPNKEFSSIQAMLDKYPHAEIRQG